MQSRIDETDALMFPTRKSPTLDKNGSKAVPTFRFGFVYMGIVGLLCFNFVLLVMAYLNARIRSDLGNVAMVVYGFANNIGQLVCIYKGSTLSFYTRIWLPCVGFAAVMVGYPLVALMGIKITFYLAVVLTCGLGFFTAISLSAGFGLASAVSLASINYYCLGLSLAGLIGWPLIVLLEFFFTKAGFSTDPIHKGTSTVDSVTTLSTLAIGAIITLGLIPYVNYLMAPKSEKMFSLLYGSKKDAESPRRLRELSDGGYDHTSIKGPSLWQTIKTILPLVIDAWLIMFISFLVIPSTLFKWKPSYEGYPGGQFFFFSLVIYLFQIFDVVGRYVAVYGFTLSELQVTILTPMRFGIAVLFWLAQAQVSVFKYDSVRFLLIAVLATTNGFFTSVVMGLAPAKIKHRNTSESSTAGYVMSFALSNGILMGSLTALAIERWTSHVFNSTSAIMTQVNEPLIKIGAGFPGT